MTLSQLENTPILVQGPINGNAHAVLGCCKRAFQRSGQYEEGVWKEIETEAQSGDYDHLLQTLMRYFEFDI